MKIEMRVVADHEGEREQAEQLDSDLQQAGLARTKARLDECLAHDMVRVLKDLQQLLDRSKARRVRRRRRRDDPPAGA